MGKDATISTELLQLEDLMRRDTASAYSEREILDSIRFFKNFAAPGEIMEAVKWYKTHLAENSEVES